MSGLTFSESEMKMLSRAWFCVDGGMPKIDYDKLATECGLAKSSANVLWNKLRRKLGSANENGAAGGGGGDGESAAATPKKTPKKRASKETPGTAEGSAKKRGRKSKAQVAAENAEEDDDDEKEGGAAKKKVKKEVVDGEEDGVGKLLLGAKEYSKNGGDGLIEAGSDDEV